MLSYNTGELSSLIATRLTLWGGICQSDCPFPWTRVGNRTYQLPNADFIPPVRLRNCIPFWLLTGLENHPLLDWIFVFD